MLHVVSGFVDFLNLFKYTAVSIELNKKNCDIFDSMLTCYSFEFWNTYLIKFFIVLLSSMNV